MTPEQLASVGALVIVIIAYMKMYYIKVPEHDSILQGAAYYDEIMRTSNPRRFFEVARMPYETFVALLSLLETEGGLKGSRHIGAGHRLMMFMHSLMGTTFASQAERWQHSKSTCCESNRQVRKAILKCRKHLYVVPKATDPIHSKLEDDKFKWFKDAIGAVDGSHVPAFVSPEDHQTFRNRKGWLSQNVMGVCNFDMLVLTSLM